MQQGSGEEYDRAMEEVAKAVQKLTTVSEAPGKLSLGTEVERAEAAVDELLGTTGSLFVNNATAGFEIAYKYANLKAGDEVIVPAITFIATMAYPLSIGCKLVFADVDPKTMCMDPADVARKITPKTKMIVPVHLGGYPVDIDVYKRQHQSDQHFRSYNQSRAARTDDAQPFCGRVAEIS